MKIYVTLAASLLAVGSSALADDAKPAQSLMKSSPKLPHSREERCMLTAGIARRARIAHDAGIPEAVFMKGITDGKYTTEIPDAEVVDNVGKITHFAYGAPAGGSPDQLRDFVEKWCLDDLSAHPDK